MALAIGGLALSAIAGVIGNGLVGQQTSDAAATALSIAESEIASAGVTQPLRSGSSTGGFAGRFEWHRRTTPYEDRQVGDLHDGAPPQARWQLYRIEVTVGWSEGFRQRHLTLATLRLGPVTP